MRRSLLCSLLCLLLAVPLPALAQIGGGIVSGGSGSGGGAGATAPGGTDGDIQINSGGIFGPYGGTSCTNQFPRSLNSAGVATCASVVFTDIGSSAYSTDTTLAGSSSSKLVTEHAVKTYVDSAAFTGLTWKNAVRVATTGAGTLASSFENGDTVDGVVLATNDRILLKNQADQTANGVYSVAASGAPTRVTDIDTSAEFTGATVLVTAGTTNASSVWTQTTASPTVGVSNIVWVQINAGTAYLAGDGLTLTGNTFAVDTTVARTTRTLTVAGTANEITSSAGAQDLSANRTWTLSLPTTLDLSTKVLQGASPLVFEGATADAFETTLTIADPTADRTITVPNENGTLCTTGSVCSGYQAASTAALNTAHYVTTQAESGLSNEFSLGSLTTGLVLNTVSASVSTPSTYAGTSCTNQFPRSLSASGVAACASVALASDVTGNLAVSHLGSGTGASSSTFWRGDGAWATPAGSGNVSTAGGTLNVLPKWDASGTVLVDSGLTDNGSVLTVNRGYRGKVASKSADYTLSTADYQIDCTAGSGGITLTLPSASGLTGQHYVIYKVDTDVGACTISPNGSDLLNGVNGAVTSLTTAYAGLDITQVSSTAWTVTSLGPLTIGDTIAASTDASVLTVGTGGVLGQVTPGTDGKVFTMVAGVPAWATAAGGVAIGDTVTSGTAGSVLWLDTAGVLAQDNAHFGYDATDRYQRIGPHTAMVDQALDDITGHPATALIFSGNSGDDGGRLTQGPVIVQSGTPATMYFARFNGATSAPSALSTGNDVAAIDFYGWDGTRLAYAASLDMIVDGTVGDYTVPMRYAFTNTNANGSQYERYRITSAGTTGVDGTACTSNGSTHCLAGQVEVQGKLIAGSAATGADIGDVDYSGFTFATNSNSSTSWTNVAGAHGFPELNFFTSGGTVASPTASVQDDGPWSLVGWIHDGTAYRKSGLIALTTTTTLSTNSFGSEMQFWVRNTADTHATQVLALDKNLHIITSGTSPTVAGTTANACGTTSPTIAGNDHAGKVTVGATAGTSCTVTFGHAFAVAPACTVTNETTANLARATSTTGTVKLAGTFVAGDSLAFSCMGF